MTRQTELYHRNLRAAGIEPETEACVNCIHFYQHYDRNADPLYCGHCAYPRFKYRQSTDTCKHFQNKNTLSGASNT